MTTTRRADGLPETEVDTRLFDLRATDYTGPIDERGVATDDGHAARVAAALNIPADH